MDDLACRLGEGACGNPQLCSDSDSPQVPGSGPDPLSPQPQWEAQAGLQAEAEPQVRKALVKGILGLLEGTVLQAAQWCWHQIAGSTCGCRSNQSCGSHGSPSRQLWGLSRFQSHPGPTCPPVEDGDGSGDHAECFRSSLEEEGGEYLGLLGARAYLNVQGRMLRIRQQDGLGVPDRAALSGALVHRLLLPMLREMAISISRTTLLLPRTHQECDLCRCPQWADAGRDGNQPSSCLLSLHQKPCSTRAGENKFKAYKASLELFLS